MPRYLLITGTIAHGALTKVAEQITDLSLEIKALRCTVAALMTTEFIARELMREAIPCESKIIVIPGLCQGSLQAIIDVSGCEVLRGPEDLIDLPEFFRADQNASGNLEKKAAPSSIKILGEIVNAANMSVKQIIEKASYYRDNGADIIDLGGEVDKPFPFLKEVIRELKDQAFKVSVDSHIKDDMIAASRAGADLILSLTSHNIEVAEELECPVVVIPDDGEDFNSLYSNMERLDRLNIPYLVDPILPPVTRGLAKGISRYLKVREDFPECEMLMGLGNVTELIDADSTGINALMVGIAGELRINYMLTTEVSHRACGVIREISLARELICKAIFEERVPKHIDDSLLTIKDAKGNSFNKSELIKMQKVIRDKNYRIFVDDKIYIFNKSGFWEGNSAQEIFPELNIKDSAHAFYLGRELEKAETALCLGKRYVQDNPLSWGYFNSERTTEREKNDN